MAGVIGPYRQPRRSRSAGGDRHPARRDMTGAGNHSSRGWPTGPRPEWRNVMAATMTSTATRHRPALVGTTIGVLVFLGISAVAGGVALVLNIGAAPPAD